MTPTKPILLLLLLYVFSAGMPHGWLLAQSKADSLLALARTMPDDTAKMRMLLRVGTMIGYNYPDSAYALMEQAVEIGNKFPGSNAHKADVLLAQAVVLQRKGDWKQTEAKTRQVMRIVQPMGDQLRIANVYNMMAITHGSFGRFDSAVYYYLLAIDLARPLSSHKMLVTALGNLAAIYGYVMNDVPKGLVSISEAIEIAEKYDFKDSQCGLYSIKGGLYSLQGDYKLAIGHYLSAGRVAHSINNVPAQAEAYSNVADAYLYKEMPVKAEEYARKALEMNAISQLESVNSDASVSLAKALVAQHRYAEALPYAEAFLQHPEPTTRQKVLVICLAAAKGAHLREKTRRYKTEFEALTIELQNEAEIREEIIRIERQLGMRTLARRKD